MAIVRGGGCAFSAPRPNVRGAVIVRGRVRLRHFHRRPSSRGLCPRELRRDRSSSYHIRGALIVGGEDAPPARPPADPRRVAVLWGGGRSHSMRWRMRSILPLTCSRRRGRPGTNAPPTLPRRPSSRGLCLGECAAIYPPPDTFAARRSHGSSSRRPSPHGRLQRGGRRRRSSPQCLRRVLLPPRDTPAILPKTRVVAVVREEDAPPDLLASENPSAAPRRGGRATAALAKSTRPAEGALCDPRAAPRPSAAVAPDEPRCVRSQKE